LSRLKVFNAQTARLRLVAFLQRHELEIHPVVGQESRHTVARILDGKGAAGFREDFQGADPGADRGTKAGSGDGEAASVNHGGKVSAHAAATMREEFQQPVGGADCTGHPFADFSLGVRPQQVRDALAGPTSLLLWARSLLHDEEVPREERGRGKTIGSQRQGRPEGSSVGSVEGFLQDIASTDSA
jgi:hypothetical protein